MTTPQVATGIMAVVQGGTFGTPFGEDPDFQIRQRLRPGENLLWSGRPDPAVRFSPADRFLVPFSIMWGGFALFWEASVIASGGPPFFVLWGIPFVIMGLYFIFGRFWFKRRQKLRTAYGITNERAIVAVGNSQVMETPIKNQPLSLTRSSDGRHGSVEFGGGGQRWGGAFYANTGMDFFERQRGGAAVAFYDVADFDALQRALDSARDQ